MDLWMKAVRGWGIYCWSGLVGGERDEEEEEQDAWSGVGFLRGGEGGVNVGLDGFD